MNPGLKDNIPQKFDFLHEVSKVVIDWRITLAKFSLEICLD